MKISESSLKDLQEIGVYKIVNCIDNKVYIGSTISGFLNRYTSHYRKLRNGTHKGHPYLQNAVNKHGIENFQFVIIEICERENCLERERFWISFYNSYNNEKGYNMIENPTKSPFSDKQVREKASKTLKGMYKEGILKPNEGTFKKGSEPWNKGRFYDSTNHLKVPKKTRGSRENFSKTTKEKQLPILVYDINNKLIGLYRYYQDIQNDVINLSNFMILKNKKGRNGYEPNYLAAFNIQKSCKTGKSYKGLFFKYEQVHDKSDKLLENPEMGNQQPIISLND